jgi:hypothetical protein
MAWNCADLESSRADGLQMAAECPRRQQGVDRAASVRLQSPFETGQVGDLTGAGELKRSFDG